MAKQTQTTKNTILSEQLLALVAEELKAPLQQIARLVELSQLGIGDESASLEGMKSSADRALRLVENFSLGLRLASWQGGSLPLEPVAVSAIASEVVNELRPLAEATNTNLELELAGRYGPVIANRQVLFTALASAGDSLLKAAANAESGNQTKLKLCLHSNKQQVEAGWYWNLQEINAEVMKRASDLASCSRRPLLDLSDQPASGIFMADYILRAMNSCLHTSKYHKLSGLSIRLNRSQQMSLIA